MNNNPKSPAVLILESDIAYYKTKAMSDSHKVFQWLYEKQAEALENILARVINAEYYAHRYNSHLPSLTTKDNTNE